MDRSNKNARAQKSWSSLPDIKNSVQDAVGKWSYKTGTVTNGSEAHEKLLNNMTKASKAKK